MHFTKAPDETITIKFEDANLEQVHTFKYLGTQIIYDAKSSTELDFRMSIAKAKFSPKTNVLTSRQFKLELKFLKL